MTKILAALATALVAVILIVVVIALVTGKDDFVVERQTTIKAPADKIQPLIADFKQWQQWSPYEKLDANLQRTFSGPTSGVGATYAYAGDKAGAGSMTITSSTPTAVAVTLNFEKPMKATNLTVFTLSPVDGGTVVSWKMSGENSLMAKVAGLFLNMDALIGGDFERGLADLKTIAER